MEKAEQMPGNNPGFARLRYDFICWFLSSDKKLWNQFCWFYWVCRGTW